MNFAAYVRKSIYSDKSDSVENQERMCREYAQLNFPGQIDHFEAYQDEGFTGANTNRPGLQRLMADISDGLIDVLVVYQIDRLSRDVRDFANIYATLKEKNIIFVSVKDSIDTKTPVGNAMVYISMTFAQLERENISNRVNDNMIGLAKRGFWTGGNPPYGYVRENIVVDGKKHVTIVPDPEGVKYVRWVFDTFLSIDGSLQSMETMFKNKGIRTVNGCFFSTTQLYKILTMPYCVPASPRIRDYYLSLGCRVEGPEEAWDGKHGVIIYGRTTQRNKRHQFKPRSEWLVCVGAHEPFISEDKWLAVQEQFNKNVFQKKMKHPIPLLKGVLRCAKCGGMMQVARKKLISSTSSHYYCTKRSRRGIEACPMRMIKADLLDNKAIDVFRSIDLDESIVRKYVSEDIPSDPEKDIRSLNKRIEAVSKKIERLTASLIDAEGSAARKYIISEIDRQDAELTGLRRELELAKSAKRKADVYNLNLEAKTAEIKRLIHDFDNLSAFDRNAIVMEVVRECTWDGETLCIRL